MVTVGGLFSGIGGIELGFEKAGFKILWSNEFDENCNKTFRHNLNHKLYSESITDINFKKIKPVDILVGGFPCQAFSVAGYRKGFKDERGNLFFQICRAIEELKTKPKVNFLFNLFIELMYMATGVQGGGRQPLCPGGHTVGAF